jgi:putative PIN family toxin of toxin-antitoxin system
LQFVILDTNVVISALLVPHGLPGRVFAEIEDRRSLLASEATLAELHEVLHRPKFDKMISDAVRKAFLKRYRDASKVIAISSSIRACRDPRDDKFLELAVDGGAEFIVSGDADLLALNPFSDVRIVAPRAFLESAGLLHQ